MPEREIQTDRAKERTTALEALYKRSNQRPSPHEMIRLITLGITPTEIIKTGKLCGYEEPIMPKLLAESKNITPYLMQVATDINTQFPQTVGKFFLGRDAETLWDVHETMFGTANNTASSNFPGSRQIWALIGKPHKQFLIQEGLSDPSQEFVLIDSGFHGTIVDHIRDAIKRITKEKTESVRNRIKSRLVCLIDSNRIGVSQIGSFELPSQPITELFPATGERTLELSAGREPALQFAQALATSMQAMPKFHNFYETIKKIKDRLVPQPAPLEPNDLFFPSDIAEPDFEAHMWEKVDPWSADPQIIHPVGALLVQYTIISEVLRLKEQKQGIRR